MIGFGSPSERSHRGKSLGARKSDPDAADMGEKSSALDALVDSELRDVRDQLGHSFSRDRGDSGDTILDTEDISGDVYANSLGIASDISVKPDLSAVYQEHPPLSSHSESQLKSPSWTILGAAYKKAMDIAKAASDMTYVVTNVLPQAARVGAKALSSPAIRQVALDYTGSLLTGAVSPLFFESGVSNSEIMSRADHLYSSIRNTIFTDSDVGAMTVHDVIDRVNHLMESQSWLPDSMWDHVSSSVAEFIASKILLERASLVLPAGVEKSVRIVVAVDSASEKSVAAIQEKIEAYHILFEGVPNLCWELDVVANPASISSLRAVLKSAPDTVRVVAAANKDLSTSIQNHAARINEGGLGPSLTLFSSLSSTQNNFNIGKLVGKCILEGAGVVVGTSKTEQGRSFGSVDRGPGMMGALLSQTLLNVQVDSPDTLDAVMVSRDAWPSARSNPASSGSPQTFLAWLKTEAPIHRVGVVSAAHAGDGAVQELPLSEWASVGQSVVSGVMSRLAASAESAPSLTEIADKVAMAPEFDAVMRFARGPASELRDMLKMAYDSVPPESLNKMISDIKQTLHSLATGDLNQDHIRFLGTTIQTLFGMPGGSATTFVLDRYRAVWDVLSLAVSNPGAMKILTPMILGTFEPTSALIGHRYLSLTEWADAKSLPEGISSLNMFNLYVTDLNRYLEHDGGVYPADLPIPDFGKNREPLPLNTTRVTAAKEKLRAQNTVLAGLADGPKTVDLSLMMVWDSSRTPPDYLARMLQEKCDALQTQFSDLSQFRCHLVLVDQNKSAPATLPDALQAVIHDQMALERDKVSIEMLTIPADHARGKGASIRYGLTELTKHADIAGFVDFSDKIHMEEIVALVSNCTKGLMDGEPKVAIGSRRLPDCVVKNKPMSFMLRSALLNTVVTSLFPKLWTISDTQTGFKCFTKDAWAQIMAQDPHSNGFASDIEWLHLASKAGIPIEESPVDFRDSLQGKFEAADEMSSGIFEDALRIRADYDDESPGPLTGNTARMIGAGAENAVFQLGPEYGDAIIKVPYETVDPDLFLVLEQVVFKDKAHMSIYQQGDRVVDSGAFKAIHDRIGAWMPVIRANKALNQMVMKMIATYEKKLEKSTGYVDSARLGAGLVCPFEQVRSPLSITIDGEEHIFPADSGVKVSVRANAVYKDALQSRLDGQPKAEVPGIMKKMIDEGLSLFRAMWRRGLIDLDANFMADTGYVEDEHGETKLMVLDPGECVANCDRIDVSTLRKQIKTRTDFLAWQSLLKSYPDASAEVLAYYETAFSTFYDELEADLKLPESHREFGKDQRGAMAETDYRLRLDYVLPTVDATPEHGVKRRALEQSRVGRQSPYRESKNWPELRPIDTRYACEVYHLIPDKKWKGATPRVGEHLIKTPMGSIVPALDVIRSLPEREDTQVVILDGGSGTRSGLLGVAAPSKGELTVAGSPLAHTCAAEMSELATALGDGYVILSSGDDVMQFSEGDREKIRGYFESGDKPGVYFCDLPDAAKDRIPMRLDQFMHFLDSSTLESSLSGLLKQIPMLKGFAKEHGAELTIGVLKPFIQDAIERADSMGGLTLEASASTAAKSESAVSAALKEVLDRFIQFIVYNGELKGGLKTPFMMVFTKAALTDFESTVRPYLSAESVTDVTWEMILIRGMKCDLIHWQLNRPDSIPPKDWDNLYTAVQSFKDRQGISFEDNAQNQARVFSGAWFNFDDAPAMCDYVKATQLSRPLSDHVTVYSDAPSDTPSDVHVESAKPAHIVSVGSKIDGHIHVAADDAVPSRHYEPVDILFYNVTVPAGKTLHVPENHMVVQIDGEIYSMNMSPCTKETLQSRQVYKYDKDGHPHPYERYALFKKNRSG